MRTGVLAAILARRNAAISREKAGEVALVVEAAFYGNVGDKFVGCLKKCSSGIKTGQEKKLAG